MTRRSPTKDIKHGVFVVVTKEATPRVIVVDDPGESVVIRSNGTAASIEHVPNSLSQMAQIENAYEGVATINAVGKQDPFFQQFQQGANPNEHANAQPQSAPSGGTGSSTPPNQLNAAPQLIQENTGVQLANNTQSGIPAAIPIAVETAIATTTSQSSTQPLVTPAFFSVAAPVLGGATAATVNEGALVTLGATDTAGSVTITGLPHDLSNFNSGSYTAASGTWTGTAAQFNALTFTAGAPGNSTLSISATTVGAAAPTTEIYTLAIQPPAVAPTITVTTAAHSTSADAAVAPFAGVSIADSNSGATDTLTITLSGAGATGTLTGTGLSGGNGGIYTLAAASPATITSELDALVFTPSAGAPGSSTTTSFTLSDVSSAGTSASNNTITVTDNDAAVAPTITVTTAAHSTSADAAVAPFAGVSIADSNSGATDTLTITLSGAGATGTLTGTAPQRRQRRHLHPGGGVARHHHQRTRCAGFHAERRRPRLQHHHELHAQRRQLRRHQRQQQHHHRHRQ